MALVKSMALCFYTNFQPLFQVAMSNEIVFSVNLCNFCSLKGSWSDLTVFPLIQGNVITFLLPRSSKMSVRCWNHIKAEFSFLEFLNLILDYIFFLKDFTLK